MDWTGNVPRVAFEIFGKPVAWYGIILTAAMLAGLLAAIVRGKKFKLKSDDLLEVFLFAIPCAILLGRLGYVGAHLSDFFFKGMTFSDFGEVFAVWDGGITIMTAVPGGVLGALLWAKIRHIDIVKAMDYIIPVVLLSQGLGRWGNFMNQEIYGAAVTNPDMQFFPFAVFIKARGGWFQACFFYEMVLDLLGFLVLIIILKRLKLRWGGTLLYVMVYATIRSFMELFRNQGDTAKDIPWPLIGCLLIVFAAAALFAVLAVRATKRGEKIWYAKGIPDKEFGTVKNYIPKRRRTATASVAVVSSSDKDDETGDTDGTVKKPSDDKATPFNKSKKKKKEKKLK